MAQRHVSTTGEAGLAKIGLVRSNLPLKSSIGVFAV